MGEDLKPCPFCGGVPWVDHIEPHTHKNPILACLIPDHKGSYCIECNCGAGFIADTYNAVSDKWNRRAT